MNLTKRFSILLLAAGLCCLTAAPADAQLTVNYDFNQNTNVNDNGQITVGGSLGGLGGLATVTDVDMRLNLVSTNAGNPMFLGDLYSTVTIGTTLGGGTRTAVLLNRPGRDNTNSLGSSLSALNVTLDDSIVRTNVWATTSSTGTYNSDGRLGVDPHGTPVPFNNADRNATLSALNGAHLQSNNNVSLLVADTDPGGKATLSTWGLSVTGTAASSGTFTPFVAAATISLSDSGTGAVNNIGATLNTTGFGNGASGLVLNFGGSATFSGGVTGTGGLTSQGPGTVILSTANTYSGNTTVNAGTLLVSNGITGSATGTGNVTINGSGTVLGGTGTISGTVTVGGVTPGAIINPGPQGTNATAASVGTLTTGALTLTGANTVHIDAFGTATTAWDKLVSTGTISLGSTSTLAVDIASGLTFTNGTIYTLLSGTALSGTFSGIADNQIVAFDGYSFQADYTATGFNLVAVPEPATWIGGAVALGATAFVRSRARKQKR